MDTLKLSQLSAKKSDNSIESIEISARIRAEHLFTSIDECLDYLRYLVDDKPFNPDDISFTSNLKYPILFVNIVEEAITSIIYEAFKLRERKDNDAIAMYRIKIDEFKDYLNHEIDKIKDITEKDLSLRISFLSILAIMMRHLSIILIPIKDHKEEFKFGTLSYIYYTLMYHTYYYVCKNGQDLTDRYYLGKRRDWYKSYLIKYKTYYSYIYN